MLVIIRIIWKLLRHDEQAWLTVNLFKNLDVFGIFGTNLELLSSIYNKPVA
jgi:hypothetical protein